MSSSAAILAGVRVLDLTRALAGPHATQMLGDLGAEVIRVTRPGVGDMFRDVPPFLKDAEGRDTSESTLYLSCNRNKQSVTIDIATPRGQQLVRELAAVCDVVVENYKVGDLARHGLDHAALSAVNPRLVYCSITGFGQTGPYRERPAYDSVFQAYSGMMSLTGHPDDQPNGGPVKTGPSIGDMMGGMYAAFAIVAALRHRDRTGEGQHIDIGLLDTTVALIGHLGMQYLGAGRQPARTGNGSPFTPLADVYRCADGAVMISAGQDHMFKGLCKVLRRPDLPQDPRFATQAARMAHRDAIEQEVVAALRERRVDDVLAGLEAEGVPVAPVNDLARAFDDPQVRARGMVVETPHPLTGSVRLVANPIRFSRTPVGEYRAPPLLGEHTEAVLTGLLGRSPAEVAALRDDGVV